MFGLDDAFKFNTYLYTQPKYYRPNCLYFVKTKGKRVKRTKKSKNKDIRISCVRWKKYV